MCNTQIVMRPRTVATRHWTYAQRPIHPVFTTEDIIHEIIKHVLAFHHSRGGHTAAWRKHIPTWVQLSRVNHDMHGRVVSAIHESCRTLYSALKARLHPLTAAGVFTDQYNWIGHQRLPRRFAFILHRIFNELPDYSDIVRDLLIAFSIRRCVTCHKYVEPAITKKGMDNLAKYVCPACFAACTRKRIDEMRSEAPEIH